MTNALATMRVDYDQVNIKDLDESDNAILRKEKNCFLYMRKQRRRTAAQ